MDNQKNNIIISSTESFYTHNKDTAYRIIKGSVLIYIVPWESFGETAGRKLLVGEFGEGKMIPSFSYRDPDYTNWRFAIVSKVKILTILKNIYVTVVQMKPFIMH